MANVKEKTEIEKHGQKLLLRCTEMMMDDWTCVTGVMLQAAWALIFNCVPPQLTTWTTGSARASWRETAAHWPVHLVSPQPWAQWWAPPFRPPRMPWMGCLQEGRWCSASDATHPAWPVPVRTDYSLCLTLTGTAAAHWQTPRPKLIPMLHSCKELGFWLPAYRLLASSLWSRMCCIVVCFWFVFFWILDLYWCL